MGESRYFLDTNIILRFLLNDNPSLSLKAKNIFIAIAKAKIEAFVTTLVIHETTYVLEKVYLLKRKDIVEKLEDILKFHSLFVIDLQKDVLLKALQDYKLSKVDFPDCIYKQISRAYECKILSFDQDFHKLKIKAYTEIVPIAQ